MTEHHYTVEQLKETGQKIKRGEEIQFDEDTLKSMWISESDFQEMEQEIGTGQIGFSLDALLSSPLLC